MAGSNNDEPSTQQFQKLQRLTAAALDTHLSPEGLRTQLAADPGMLPFLQQIDAGHPVLVEQTLLMSEVGGVRTVPLDTVLQHYGDNVTVVIGGDVVLGDKVLGDSVAGDKIIVNTTLTPTARRQRMLMLERVHAFWITNVLERSLAHTALINLDLRDRPDAVLPLRTYGITIDTSNQSIGTPPSATGILPIFDRLKCKMLILGEPGSGKTTLLLELTQALLERVRHDESHPIPVVFNLSTWARRCLPLHEWLIEELRDQYQVSPKLGNEWLNQLQLIPLLDGLDEVQQAQRAACVTAINTFQQEYAPEQIAVCCRVAEFEALQTRLLLQGAVTVQPLSMAQIETFIERIGPPLATVRAALPHDEELRALATSPLMLGIMTIAYRDQPAGSIIVRDRLFATYIDRMLSRPPQLRVHFQNDEAELPKGSEPPPYTREETLHWLHWLAQYMQRHGETIFQIEQLQPDALPDKARRWYYLLTLRSGGVWGGFASPRCPFSSRGGA